MKDLQREQREMRARMKRDTGATVKEQQTSLTEAHFQQDNGEPGANDTKKLQKQIADLESENRELKAQIASLRRQKTVYVEREKSGEDQRREQQHNYFKYSNARRW
jgi:hypothetical protein